MTEDYFDERMVNRERLFWTVATRRQLERWERIVAEVLRGELAGRPPDGEDVWSAQIEHHFTLVAGRHLLRALALPPATRVSVDPTIRAELFEARNLHEQWRENMPVFNVTPRVAEPPIAQARTSHVSQSPATFRLDPFIARPQAPRLLQKWHHQGEGSRRHPCPRVGRSSDPLPNKAHCGTGSLRFASGSY